MRTLVLLGLVSAFALAGAAQAGGYGADTYRVERPSSISRHVYRHYDQDNDSYRPSHHRPHHYRPHHYRPQHYRPHHHRPSYYDHDDHWSIHYYRPGDWSIHYYD